MNLDRSKCLYSMRLALVVVTVSLSVSAAEDSRVLESRLRHLRIEGPREWATFSEKPDASELDLRFPSTKNDAEWTLRWRQQDVKQKWDVLLNGKKLDVLVGDENDMLVYVAVPAGKMIDGENRLRIQQTGRRNTPDDIRVGEVLLYGQSRGTVLNRATVRIKVTDKDSGRPTPCRITVVNKSGPLQTTGAESNDHLAVRPGVVYTSTGLAEFGLPPGEYAVFAGRGFEYSLASTSIEVKSGDEVTESLEISRGVDTRGYVACDTHVHTLTHSGHGDSTVQERMITLAAEGIELPIATDHNKHIDHRPFAEEMRVRRYFTPVIGNEVTTKIGHFNIFPVQPGAELPDHQLNDWKSILNDIHRTPGVKVAILNHARDLHSGVRPFAPQRFNAAIGENLDGWAVRFNAMEVINSSAIQTDPLRLFHDWMALLNRGYRVTPVGSSDSHDVARHFVGQGRTYIRCDDTDPGHIDVATAVNNFRQGRVMVSYGLLTEIEVDEKYTSGETAPAADEQVKVTVRVQGPEWVKATRVELFANGVSLHSAEIPKDAQGKAGTKWRKTWTIARPKHDVHLVAIATGPGIDGLYWKTAKPYQPLSPRLELNVIGCSGAVWLDADGDGRQTPAADYAHRVLREANGDLKKLVNELAGYDQAIASQAAHLYQSTGKSLLDPAAQQTVNAATRDIQIGFRNYIEAWRASKMRPKLGR